MPTSASCPRIWSRLAATLSLTLIVLFALACAAPSRPSYGGAPAPGGYGGDAAGEAEYAQSYDYVAVAESAAPPPAPMRERFEAKQKKRDAAATTPAQAPATSEPSGAAEPPPAEPVEPGEAAPASAATRRQIIYTAGLGLRVFEIDETMAKLEALPDRHGGWIEQRYDDRIVLRVPAAKLDAIMAEVSEWGVVVDKTLMALDVTAEYTDLDSRIRVLEQMEAQLLALLERAQNVEQALAIQMELTRIRAELEGLRAQMRLLASAVEFSTLAVQLYRQGVEAPPIGNDPFTWVDSLGAEATEYR